MTEQELQHQEELLLHKHLKVALIPRFLHGPWIVEHVVLLEAD